MAHAIQCGTRRLSLHRPRIMGILNLTPDSFSDGGRYTRPDAALRQVETMLADGADIIDIGGESTRPGAAAVSATEELDRVMPLVQAVLERFDTIVSIDTSKAEVMREAAAAGAGLINDVRALREPGALDTAAATGLPVCLMHMRGEPRTMQQSPEYDDVLETVEQFLVERIRCCREAGMADERLLVDPGFGFGKSYAHNLALLRGLPRLTALAPVLCGLSRKRMIAAMLGDEARDRTVASATAAMLCVQYGAAIVRVHDVAATRDALAVYGAVHGSIEQSVKTERKQQ